MVVWNGALETATSLAEQKPAPFVKPRQQPGDNYDRVWRVLEKAGAAGLTTGEVATRANVPPEYAACLLHRRFRSGRIGSNLVHGHCRRYWWRDV